MFPLIIVSFGRSNFEFAHPEDNRAKIVGRSSRLTIPVSKLIGISPHGQWESLPGGDPVLSAVY